MVKVPQGFSGFSMIVANWVASGDVAIDCFFSFLAEACVVAQIGFLREPTDFACEVVLHRRPGCLRGRREPRLVVDLALAMMSRRRSTRKMIATS